VPASPSPNPPAGPTVVPSFARWTIDRTGALVLCRRDSEAGPEAPRSARDLAAALLADPDGSDGRLIEFVLRDLGLELPADGLRLVEGGPDLDARTAAPVDPAGGTESRLVASPSIRIAPADLEAVIAGLHPWLLVRDHLRRLRDLAIRDGLTGAGNRRWFDAYLAWAIAEADRAGLAVTLLLFDIDDFKSFNDRHGHGAGDAILRETVRLLASVIRPDDVICRVGGDEFAVVFFDPAGSRAEGSRPPDDVLTVAQRFRDQIAHERFPKLGAEAPDRLTISGGLARYLEHGRTAGDLLRHADLAAGEAKRTGKNAIVFGP